MRLPALILTLLLPLAVAPARAAQPDPIDARLQTCLGAPSGSSTQGMVECISAATTAYDRRLNEAYIQALSVLDPDSKEKLRIAQRAWLAFRRAEEVVYGGAWRTDRGTIMRVVLANAALSALKERVAELEAYVNN